MTAVQTILGMEYKIFDGGSYVAKMPELIAAGFSPMSFAFLMRAKIEAAKSIDSAKRHLFLGNYLYSGDGAASYGDIVKVVYDSEHLRNINKNSVLRNGALELSVPDFNSLEGVVFSRNELEKYGVERNLSRAEAKAHPVWKTLARNYDALLSECVDVVFDEMKQRYDYDEGMGVYLPSDSNVPLLRAWVVISLNGGSDALGSHNLGSDARLIGVRAEGASSERARSAALNPAANYTREEVERAIAELAALKIKGLFDPELVASLEALLGKL